MTKNPKLYILNTRIKCVCKENYIIEKFFILFYLKKKSIT